MKRFYTKRGKKNLMNYNRLVLGLFLCLLFLLPAAADSADVYNVNPAGYKIDGGNFTPCDRPLDAAWEKAAAGDILVIYADKNNTKSIGIIKKSEEPILTSFGTFSTYVNQTGYKINGRQFIRCDAPLHDAWENASAGQVIVIYADKSNTKIIGIVKKPKMTILGYWGAFLAALAVLLSFFAVLWLGYKNDNKLNKGEMRRALTSAFIVGFHILLIISLLTDFKTEIVVPAYVTAVTTILGFYFGSRTVQQSQNEEETKPVVGIENVEFKEKQIAITFRNGSSKELELDTVYLNNKPQKIEKTKVAAKSVKVIPTNIEWKAGTKYSIKVCNLEGSCFEAESSAPKEGN